MSPCLAEEMLGAESPTFLIKQHTQLSENGGLSLLRGPGKGVGRCRVVPGRHVLQARLCGGEGVLIGADPAAGPGGRSPEWFCFCCLIAV